MSFKTLAQEDIKAFLNVEEFADVAIYNGYEINVLYDKYEEDRFINEYILCNKDDVADITTSSIFIIYNKTYTASSWSEKSGIMEIALNVQN